MAKVSIIIPVYNTGNYLYKCVESVLNQTYKDIEIIIIDDGSKEETAQICDEIAKEDKRIRLIHKQNEGVSVARNIGLDMVTGDYVGFIDSDDWIDLDMFESLVCEMEEYDADIVMCDATTIWDNGKNELDTFICLPQSCTLTGNHITPQLQLELAGACWRALYRTSLLRTENIKFPAGIKFSEDRIFNMIALGIAKRFRYIKKSFYNRFMREDSCVHTFHKDFVNVTLKVNEMMSSVLRKYWDESYIPVFEQRNLRGIGNHVVNVFLVDNMPINMRWKEVKKICQDQQLQDILRQQCCLNFPLRQIVNQNIYFLYIFHKKPVWAIPFCFLAMYKEPWALLGFGLTLTYNGERGRQNKIVNYFFYPVHLFVLGMIKMYFGF